MSTTVDDLPRYFGTMYYYFEITLANEYNNLHADKVDVCFVS